MKIKEILYTKKYVHPDVEKILDRNEKRAKARKSKMTMGFPMGYPYRVR